MPFEHMIFRVVAAPGPSPSFPSVLGEFHLGRRYLTGGIMDAAILVGDCLNRMRELPDKCVWTCVTSPPYFGLRDYGVDGQIGLEATPDEFVAKMVEVFREVRRVLRDDGTLWLNLGDSYARNPAKGATGTPNGRNIAAQGYSGGGGIPTGTKEKDLIGIPWRVAFALQADGWYLRQDIIWHKPNPMPESVRDRCTKAHEYIFLLSKSPKYYFDHEAMQEPCVKGAAGSEFHTGKTGEHQLGRASKKRSVREGVDTKGGGQGSGEISYPSEIRNRRDVWTVSTKPFAGAHFATFPPDLIEPCVLAGCPVGGIVLDPFNGAGTTGLVALRNQRHYLGCELNPEYAAMAETRIRDENPMMNNVTTNSKEIPWTSILF